MFLSNANYKKWWLWWICGKSPVANISCKSRREHCNEIWIWTMLCIRQSHWSYLHVLDHKFTVCRKTCPLPRLIILTLSQPVFVLNCKWWVLREEENTKFQVFGLNHSSLGSNPQPPALEVNTSWQHLRMVWESKFTWRP